METQRSNANGTRLRAFVLKHSLKPEITRQSIYEQTNVPIRTQRAWKLQRDRGPGSNRPGARKVITDRALYAMVRYVSKSFENRRCTWLELAQLYGDGYSPATVKAAMNKAGYYKCKECQMTFLSNHNITKRRAFAKLHETRPLTCGRSTRFTDETHFALESRAAVCVIRDSSERYHSTCIQYKNRSRGSQLHAWTMIGYGYRCPLVFFDSNNTSERSDWTDEAIGMDTDTLQTTKETLDEELQLLGDGRPSTCKHRCHNKEACKHDCCKANYRP
jgi:hypothetical protein